MNTARLNKNGQVSIPAEIRKKLKLGPGDNIGFDLTPEGKVILQPVAIVSREQAYFFNSKIQKKIKKAEMEIASGKGISFDDANKALAWLKS